MTMLIIMAVAVIEQNQKVNVIRCGESKYHYKHEQANR